MQYCVRWKSPPPPPQRPRRGRGAATPTATPSVSRAAEHAERLAAVHRAVLAAVFLHRMVPAIPPQFETLRLSWLDEEGHVLLVELNRPRKRNAINWAMWSELRECFATLQSLDTLRCVLLSGGESASFCGGIDISEFGQGREQGADTARSGLIIRRKVIEMQQAFGAMEALSVPVVACVHGACVGAGVDMITACDVRWTSADAFFCVKEVGSPP